MKKGFWAVSAILLLGMTSTYYLGCNKTNSPFGVYAPQGLDVPSLTPTPAIGAINCYVFDRSPKMGVTVNLVDPVGNTLFTKTTDQYGNTPFSPYPLIVGTYNANVPKQGRYGYSTIPITIVSTSQGAVSVQFLAASQALSIIGGIPVSFLTGTGAFPVTLAYLQPGTLDVPISVVNNALEIAWTTAPSTFVMNMAVSTQAVTINKTSCTAINQAVTWTGVDFLGLSFISNSTELFRNFPVNVTLNSNAFYQSPACSTGSGKAQCVFTLSTTNDCSIGWTLNATIVRYNTNPSNSISTTNFSTVLSNGGSVTFTDAKCYSTFFGTQWSCSISSPVGSSTNSGFGNGSGTVINTSF